jgi:hypothetical protein
MGFVATQEIGRKMGEFHSFENWVNKAAFHERLLRR